MSLTINDLPDKILKKIFILTTPRIEESMNISQVCKRWNDLMKKRFALVECLIEHHCPDENIIHPSGKFLMFNDERSNECPVENNQVNYIPLYERYLNQLPNLMVFESDYSMTDQFIDFAQMINSKPSLQCLRLNPIFLEEKYPLFGPAGLAKISMLSCPVILDSLSLDVQFRCREIVTQLYFCCAEIDFDVFTHFPRLKRLHLSSDSDKGYDLNLPRPMNHPEKPFLSELEILEVYLEGSSALKKLIRFLGHCPQVRSIFFRQQGEQKKLVNEPILFTEVENLVLETTSDTGSNNEWITTSAILSMFPNLRNLAIRYFKIVKETELDCALTLLPKLEYLEITERHIVEDYDDGGGEHWTAFKSILCPLKKIKDRYLDLHKKDIEFVVKVEMRREGFEREVPYTQTMAEDFDFMKNVFPHNFFDIPYFLIEKNSASNESREENALAIEKCQCDKALRKIHAVYFGEMTDDDTTDSESDQRNLGNEERESAEEDEIHEENGVEEIRIPKEEKKRPRKRLDKKKERATKRIRGRF